MKIHCLNKIAPVGVATLGDTFTLTDDFSRADAVLVRSAAMHEMELPEQLLAIARAGAGVNNIPLDKCAEQGVVVFNTPGANANGVKEAVIAAMLMAARDLVGGINWVQSEKANPDIAKLVEKEKKNFAGSEIMGKKIGVIGLGAVGVLVANACVGLGLEVYGYDPFISVDAAWSLSKEIRHISNLDDIYASCDYITVHVPLLDGTRRMLNADAFAKMKDGVVILNFARDLLVDEEAIAQALASGRVKKYVTDFPNPLTVNMPGAVAIPHLGASTEEAEENCAVMAARQVREFVLNGDFRDSVSYPACALGVCKPPGRLSVCHKNIPNILSQLTSACAAMDINIENMIDHSKGNWAYTLMDITSPVTDSLLAQLMQVNGVVKVRKVK